MDEVFKALADVSRRRLLDSLNARSGQTLRELCAGLDMTRQSVSKHLAVLEAAGLVTTEWRGREKLHHLNAAPIDAVADRWISRYHRGRVRALGNLKTALEQKPMTFAYTTYIYATPEQTWKGLTDPAFTSSYWGVVLESSWKEGSTFTWEQNGVKVSDPGQIVLESDPYRRLAYTFHSFTPEFVEAMGFSDEVRARVTSESRSKVAFDIEPFGDKVKLTVVHDDFPPGSKVLELISGGWPVVISNLKTYLESSKTSPAVPNMAH